MIKLADIYSYRNGKPNIEFFLLGIYDLLKDELGFRYNKLDGKGYYLKEKDGNYEIVKFITLKDEFRNYVSNNFEKLEISKHVGRNDFMNEYYKKMPIKNGNYAREYLSEGFELSEDNKHLLRLEIDDKYRRIFSRNKMISFLKQEDFTEFETNFQVLQINGSLFYKKSSQGYFLVFNNPFHGGKVISSEFDLYKVYVKTRNELLNKKLKQTELVKIAFSLQNDMDIYKTLI